MDTAAAEQIARLLAQVEPLSRDNERLAADNASLARAAAEAGRAHQGLVRDAVADRLRAQRQVRQRAAPVPDGIRIQVPGRADIAPEHGQLGDEGLGAVAVQAAGEDEGAAAGRRHSPRRRDRGAGAQGARARGQAQVAHVAVRGARVREADIHLRIQPGRARQIRTTPQGGGWLRNSAGVSPFSLTRLRLVSQWATYTSRSALKDSKSGHLLPWKNSSFMCLPHHGLFDLAKHINARAVLFLRIDMTSLVTPFAES